MGSSKPSTHAFSNLFHCCLAFTAVIRAMNRWWFHYINISVSTTRISRVNLFNKCLIDWIEPNFQADEGFMGYRPQSSSAWPQQYPHNQIYEQIHSSVDESLCFRLIKMGLIYVSDVSFGINLNLTTNKHSGYHYMVRKMWQASLPTPHLSSPSHCMQSMLQWQDIYVLN
jgi:hypothetical protein